MNFITPILEAIPIGSQRRIFDALAQLVFVAPQLFAMGAMLVPARARRRTAADGITWGAGRGRVTLTRGRGVALRWRRTAGNATQLAINIGDIAMAATCVCQAGARKAAIGVRTLRDKRLPRPVDLSAALFVAAGWKTLGENRAGA